MFDNEADTTTEANGKVILSNAKRELKRECPKQKELSAKTKRLLNRANEAAQAFGVAVVDGHLDYTAAVATTAYAKTQAALIKHLLKLEQIKELLK